MRMKKHSCNNKSTASLVVIWTKERLRCALHIEKPNKTQRIAKLIQFVPVQTVRCIVLLKCDKRALNSVSLNIIKENPILHIDSITHTHNKKRAHRQTIFQTTLLSTANHRACMHRTHTGVLCECTYKYQWLNKNRKIHKYLCARICSIVLFRTGVNALYVP